MRAATGVIIVIVALLACASTLRAQPTPADVYVEQAVIDFDEKRYDAALDNLRRALEIEPQHVEALYYTGVVHLARGHPEQAIPFLERAHARAPANIPVTYQLGLAHFARQDYERAQPLLEQVFRADPNLEGLAYYVGFMRYRNKDYRGAVNAFRSGRVTDPQLQQLSRLYSGLALAALGLPGQAERELTEAVRLVPASPVTGPVERLRDTIATARGKDRRFAFEVRVGGFYDDNVSVIPDADDHEPLVPILRRPKHESFGELYGVRAEYVWYRGAALDATIGYSFFGTYNNEIPSFNVMDHLGSLGLDYRTALGTMPLQLSAQYAFDILFLDDNEFVRRHSPTLAAALVESDRHLTQAFVRYQRKDFNEIPPLPVHRDIRDANNYMGGFLHLVRFAADRHFIKGGYQFDYEDAEGKNWAYRGHRLLAGAQYTLPWAAIRLKYDFDVHLRDYIYNNSLLPSRAPGTKRRQDEEFTNIVRVELPLPAGFTIAGEYQSTLNRSNLAVFQYTRNVSSITLSWAY